MLTVKNKMRLLLPTCFKPEKTLPGLENQVSRPTSCPRLSFLDQSNSFSSFSVFDISNSLVGSELRVFTVAELQSMTKKFSKCNFLGEGGFGPVYKGYIDDNFIPGLEAQTVAVKLMVLGGSQGHREWLAEIICLGQLRHPHLVKLIGYCCEDEHRLLVYEYMTGGSLENRLFKKYCISLPWQTRMKIALGAARGLAFLHEEENQVIYRDLNSSNILLDANYNPKLSDFGLATDGPQGSKTHITTRVMGTKGYAAPEYLTTGKLTTMIDVYSFGMVLLELITGRRSIDEKRPKREKNLIEWARPVIKDLQKFDRLIDPRLEGEYSIEGAKIAISLAHRCLSRCAKSRPSMSNVVKCLEKLVDLDDDCQSKSFVYIVPNENEEGNGNELGSERMQIGNEIVKRESIWRSSALYRYRLRSLKSPVVYSEKSQFGSERFLGIMKCLSTQSTKRKIGLKSSN